MLKPYLPIVLTTLALCLPEPTAAQEPTRHYADGGEMAQAIAFYEKELGANGWRWEQQLILARLLHQAGATKAALKRAQLVYLYSEDNDLISQAEEVLHTLGLDPAKLKSRKPKNSFDQTEIVLVPIGKLKHLRLLEEAGKELQARTGILYSVAHPPMNPGKADQTSVDRYLQALKDAFVDTLPQKQVYEVLEEQKLTFEELKTIPGMIHFLERTSGTSALPSQIVTDIYLGVRQLELENEDWFDAERLINALKQQYLFGKKSQVRGYLGVTETALYDGQEAAYAKIYPGTGYGLFTDRLLVASTNPTEQNRPRLRKEFSREVLYDSFRLLGIPRCDVPVCILTDSPDSFADPSGELCPLCEGLIFDYLDGIKPGVYPGDMEATLLLARLYAQADREEALTLYRDLLRRYPQSPRPLTEFLWFCADNIWWPYGQDEFLLVREGMSRGEVALAQWQDDPAFLEAYGWLSYQVGQLELASRLLERAVSLPGGRELYGEGGTHPVIRGGMDRPAMLLNDSLDNVKS